MGLEATACYPLNWPEGWPRTLAHLRVQGPFRHEGRRIVLSVACDRLDRILRLISAVEPKLSTNLPLRNDGRIRRDAREPEDGGAALHFKRDTSNVALAADKFAAVADNVAALAAYLEALRATVRHGVGSLDRVFTGYLVLPAPPTSTGRSWREILEHPATQAEASDNYRRLAKAAHIQGNAEARLLELNIARAQARLELP